MGALHGASGLPDEWVAKATSASTVESRYSGEVSDAPTFDNLEIAQQLEKVLKDRLQSLNEVSDTIHAMSS